MDSVTHLLAGACIAAAIAPPAQRRLALGAGALLNTLPDVDYLWLAFADPVSRFVSHRGFTHSLFVLPFAAIACWLLLRRFAPVTRASPGRWLAICVATLLAHPLLDAMTVYGTQLFWPFADAPVMHANLFIIDPLLTLPLLVGVAGAWRLGADPRGQGRVLMALALAATYIGWTLIAKQHLDTTVRAHFAAKGAPDIELLTVPTPFNSVLWRVLVMSGDAYAEGYYSFLGAGKLELQAYPGQRALPEPLASSDAAVRLKTFTRGYYRIDRVGDRYVFVDLRMGAEPDYVFRFAIGEVRDGRVEVLEPPEQYPWPRRLREQLARVRAKLFVSRAIDARADGST